MPWYSGKKHNVLQQGSGAASDLTRWLSVSGCIVYEWRSEKEQKNIKEISFSKKLNFSLCMHYNPDLLQRIKSQTLVPQERSSFVLWLEWAFSEALHQVAKPLLLSIERTQLILFDNVIRMYESGISLFEWLRGQICSCLGMLCDFIVWAGEGCCYID